MSRLFRGRSRWRGMSRDVKREEIVGEGGGEIRGY